MASTTIEIDTDLGTLDADLRRAGKMALRELSDGIREGHRQYLRDNLDNLTPFSEDSLYVVGTPSTTPELLVVIKDHQAEHLQSAYLGGHRDHAVTPTLDANLDSDGDLTRGYASVNMISTLSAFVGADFRRSLGRHVRLCVIEEAEEFSRLPTRRG